MLPNVSHLFFIADAFGCSCPVSLPWILKQQKNRPRISFLTPWLKTGVQVLEYKHASLKKKQSNKHLSFILYQGSYLCNMHFEMESDVRHLFKLTFKRFPRKKWWIINYQMACDFCPKLRNNDIFKTSSCDLFLLLDMYSDYMATVSIACKTEMSCLKLIAD